VNLRRARPILGHGAPSRKNFPFFFLTRQPPPTLNAKAVETLEAAIKRIERRKTREPPAARNLRPLVTRKLP